MTQNLLAAFLATLFIWAVLKAMDRNDRSGEWPCRFCSSRVHWDDAQQAYVHVDGEMYKPFTDLPDTLHPAVADWPEQGEP